MDVQKGRKMSIIKLIEQLKAMPEKMDGRNGEGEFVVLNTHKLADELKKSLRNCDVGTVEEQCNRHDKYCNLQTTCKRWLRDNDSSMCILCFANWLHNPYKEEIIV